MAKRSDAAILEDIKDIECQLSPENLTCDGEASGAYVRKRSASLNKKLKLLETELGRKPSLYELYPEFKI